MDSAVGSVGAPRLSLVGLPRRMPLLTWMVRLGGQGCSMRTFRWVGEHDAGLVPDGVDSLSGQLAADLELGAVQIDVAVGLNRRSR